MLPLPFLWLLAVLGLLGAVAVAALALGLFPPTPHDLGGARDLDAEAERVRIPLPEGDYVEGWHLPGSRPRTVVLFHGYGRTHARAWRYGGFLRDAGYGVLAIDFRSSRKARRLPTTLGHHELEDAVAAIGWAAANNEAGPVLLGESLGGTVALLAAGQCPEVAAVIVDCPFSTGKEAVEDMLTRFLRLPRPSAELVRTVGRWSTGHDPYRIDAVEAMTRLRGRPILFIHSEADERLASDQSKRLWEAAGSKDPVWWVPAAGHNEAMLRHPDEYRRRVLDFLESVATR